MISGYIGLATTQSIKYDFFPLVPRPGGRSVQVLTDGSHLEGAGVGIILFAILSLLLPCGAGRCVVFAVTT